VVRYLLDLGAEAKSDNHALSLAVGKGHDEVARLLISRGVDPKDNPDALPKAVLQNNVALGTPHHCPQRSLPQRSDTTHATHGACLSRITARLLLEHGAGQHVNATFSTGIRISLPLHVAVTKGHYEMVKLLLAHGADPRLQLRYDGP